MKKINDFFNILYLKTTKNDDSFLTAYFKNYPEFILKISNSGKDTLKLLKKNNYDALIIDSCLTDMNNVDFLKVLAKQDNKIPVIILTSNEIEEQVMHSIKLGAKDYIFKSNDYIIKLPDIIKKTINNSSKIKESEESLLKTTERLNFLISSNPAVIYTCEAFGNYNITFISENVFRYFGYHASDFIKDSGLWYRLAHPDDVKTIMSVIPILLEQGSTSYEYRFLHANGTYRWLHNEIRVVKDEKGEPLEFIGSWIDITERKVAEIALQEANEQIISIFSNLEEGYFSQNYKNNSVLNISAGYAKIYGLTEQDFLNDPDLWFKKIYRDDVELIKESFTKLEPNEVQTVEHRIIRTDGEIRWIRIKLIPIFDNDTIVRIDGVISDITEQKLSQEKFIESESRFRNSFDNAAIGKALTGMDGKFLEVNKSFCEMLGYTEKELLSGNYVSITHPEDLDSNIEIVKGLIDGNLKSVRFEKRYIHKSGVIIWTRLNTTLHKDKQGNPLYFITQMEDITDKKSSEEKLIEQAALLDITTDSILVRDMNHNIIFWNKGAEELYGYKKEEVTGKKITETIYESDLSQFESAFKDVLENQHWEGELEHVTKSGNTVIVDSKWTLMKDKTGNPVSILVVNSDITQKKYIEKEYLRIDRLDSIGTLASGIAHDLNNVLAPIMMGVEILKMRTTDQKGLKLLETMTSSTRHGAQLVKQILTFARGIETEYSPVAIEDILTEVNNMLSSSFPKNIDIMIDIPEKLKLINGDSTQLNQVLMNMMVNARDAMPKGGTIRISVSNIYLDAIFVQMNPEANKTGYYILITVSDSGSGIPDDIIDKIYEPFFTTKGIGKGTGLGLSTSIGIVRSHGGFINVSSKKNIGTEFKIYIPATVTTDETVIIENSEQMLSGNGETILLIEDEPSIREATTQALEQHNYQAIIACDGAEGIATYAQNREIIKLVISNVTLPVMDGHQVVIVILKMNPQEKIIMISGLEQTANIREYTTQVKFIKKPFMASSLLLAVHELLNNPD